MATLGTKWSYPATSRIYGICPAFYDYPRTRERNLESSDKWIGVHQPAGPGAVHRAAVLSRRYPSTALLPLRTFRCNRRAYERWRSGEKGLPQTRGRSNPAYKSRRMCLEVIYQLTAHSTSQRTDSYAKSKHAGSRVVVEPATSIGGSK